MLPPDNMMMLCNRNTVASRRRRIRFKIAAACAMLISAPGGLWPAAATLAQNAAAPGSSATPEVDAAAESIATYNTMAAWVRAWETPDEHPLPAGTSGLWVGLRWSGRLMGMAENMESAVDFASSSRAVTGAMHRAMADALDRAEGSEGDALEREERAARFREIPCTLDVQFALQPQRVRAASARGLADVIRPGLDGILLRIDDRIHAIFPAEMMLSEQMPMTAIELLRVDLGLSDKQFDDSLSDGTFRAWKFSVIHLAQDRSEDSPFTLYRGSRVVPFDSITQTSLETFARELVDHLAQRRWPGNEPLGIMGTYLADVDRFDPMTAGPPEQALAALALARYAHVRKSRSPDTAAKATDFAWAIIDDLAERADVDVNPVSAAGTAAVVVLALDELEGTREFSPEVASLRQMSMNAVRAAFDRDAHRFSDRLTPSERAACAEVLATRDAIDAVWQSTSIELQPSLLPWIGWAEQDLAGSDGPIASAGGLRALRNRLWATQVDMSRAGSSEEHGLDEFGGLVLRDDVMPDWNTARPVAFLASMLRDPRLTDDELDSELREILNLTQAFRFLRQLSIREDDSYRLPDADRAMNGVRASLISDRLPVSASAMTLIALSELLRSFDAIEARRAEATAETANSGRRR